MDIELITDIDVSLNIKTLSKFVAQTIWDIAYEVSCDNGLMETFKKALLRIK